jgi:uncharacterized integral membrane protein
MFTWVILLPHGMEAFLHVVMGALLPMTHVYIDTCSFPVFTLHCFHSPCP